MTRNYTSYIPQTPGELVDQVASMVLSAPKFIDELGDFPHHNLENEFHVLTTGLANVRKRIGEERFVEASDLIARMRPLFEADQDDVNGKTTEGRKLLIELMELLMRRKAAPAPRLDTPSATIKRQPG